MKTVKNKIISSYKNGNYNVTIFEDGTKIRENDQDFFDADRPESIDCTVTYKCTIGCPYCYQGCTKNGITCNYKDPIIETFLEGMEVAIGASSGVFDDDKGKSFESFLRKLKRKKCIPSITVNQYHLIKHIDIIKKWIKQKLVYGVGVSISQGLRNYTKLSSVLFNLEEENLHNNIVLHTIAGIHTIKDFEKISGIFKADYKPKVLILGYKNIGRGKNYLKQLPEDVLKNINELKDNIKKIANLYTVCSFDNPACIQLELKNKYSNVWNERYLGDDGSHTFYLDLAKRTFSISSLHEESYPINEFKSIKEMFLFVKEKSKLTICK